MITYTFKDLVCIVLEHVLKKNEVDFFEVYYKNGSYYLKVKRSYDTKSVSTKTLIKLFGKEHSLYLILNRKNFYFGILYLIWVDDLQCYVANTSGDTWRLASELDMGEAYKIADESFANFFTKLHPLIQSEAQLIESIILKLTDKESFTETEARNIFNVIQYAPPLF